MIELCVDWRRLFGFPEGRSLEQPHVEEFLRPGSDETLASCPGEPATATHRHSLAAATTPNDERRKVTAQRVR